MKSTHAPKVTSLVLIAVIGLAVVVKAQPNPRRPGESQPPGEPRSTPQRPMGGIAARFGPGYERVFNVLTDDQRVSLREAMEKERDKTRALEEKLRQARKELFDLGLLEKFNEDAFRQKALAGAQYEAEMTVLRAKAFSQIQPPLSAEQLEKLKNFADQPFAEGNRESIRRRRDIPRDENGLPLPRQPKSDGSQEPAPKPPTP